MHSDLDQRPSATEILNSSYLKTEEMELKWEKI